MTGGVDSIWLTTGSVRDQRPERLVIFDGDDTRLLTEHLYDDARRRAALVVRALGLVLVRVNPRSTVWLGAIAVVASELPGGWLSADLGVGGSGRLVAGRGGVWVVAGLGVSALGGVVRCA